MLRVLLVNGRPVEPGQPAVAADDPGLYGQGVYESLRTYGGEPFAVGRHLDRLERGARGLGLEPDREALERELQEAAAAARAAGMDGELTLRLLHTAGGVRIVEAGPLLVRTPSARAVTLPWRRLAEGPLVGIKAASTAAVAVARRHVAEAGADEGVWLTPDGRVSEALAANVWVVLRGELLTPPLADGALAGVTRSLLLELGGEERTLSLHDVLAAEEAFLSATSLPARALISLDGRPIADGCAGPRTRELRETFAARARALLGDEA